MNGKRGESVNQNIDVEKLPDRPVVLYQYHPTRKGKVPLDFLKDYQGYVQTDGYKGYDELGRRKGITLVGCMAHARRRSKIS